MVSRVVRAWLAVVFAGLAGCTTPRNEYVPPADLTSQSGATLVGTKQENPNLLIGDLRVYHVAIDKKLTLVGPHGWDKPILVPIGEHIITIGVGYGTKRFGFGEARVNFEPGKTYVLQARRHGDWSAIGWIEEQHGRPVSEEVTVQLAEGRPLMPLIIVPRK